MRDIILAIALFTGLTQIGQASPWTYTDDQGIEQNTDACPYQDCRGVDRELPTKPKPGEPIIIEEPGDKGPRLQADKSDKEPTHTTVPGYYCLLKGKVVNFRYAPEDPPEKVTRVCPWGTHKAIKNGGVPGLFGPHEGSK